MTNKEMEIKFLEDLERSFLPKKQVIGILVNVCIYFTSIIVRLLIELGKIKLSPIIPIIITFISGIMIILYMISVMLSQNAIKLKIKILKKEEYNEF